jgi:hypothetical protein
VSRVGLGSSTQNLGFFLRSKCEPLFIIFWGLDFDGCSSVVSPLGVLVPNIFV